MSTVSVYANGRRPYVLFFLCVLFFSCRTADDEALRQLALDRFPAEKPYNDSEFMMVDGVRLHVRQRKACGEYTDQPKGLVVLVSGVSGTTHNWRHTAPEIADDGWNVLTCDIPPFGFSGEKQESGYALDPLPEDSFSRAALLWHFIEAVYPGYNGILVIAGHSLGGRIASIMTLKEQERVSKLILVAPAVYGRSAIPTAAKYWPIKQIAVPAVKKLLADINVIRFFADTAYGIKVDDEQLAATWAPLLREGNPEAFAVWADKSVDREAPDMKSISVPTLILWGTYDPIVANQGKRLEKEMMQACYIEVPCKSHAVMVTHHEQTTAHIIQFLNSASAEHNIGTKITAAK